MKIVRSMPSQSGDGCDYWQVEAGDFAAPTCSWTDAVWRVTACGSSRYAESADPTITRARRGRHY